MTRELLQETKSSVELDAELAACKTAKERAIAALNDLGKERVAALLSAADSRVDEIEEAIKRQGWEIERQGARLRDLEGAVARAVEREQAEAQAASQKCLEAVYAYAEKLQLEEYARRAAELAEMMLVLDAARECIRLHGRPGVPPHEPNEARRSASRVIPGRSYQKLISHPGGVVIKNGATGDNRPLRYETAREPDQIKGGQLPQPLVDTVVLPRVRYEDADFWSPHSPGAGASYLEILRRAGLPVDALESADAQASGDAAASATVTPRSATVTVEVGGGGASVMRDGRRIA